MTRHLSLVILFNVFYFQAETIGKLGATFEFNQSQLDKLDIPRLGNPAGFNFQNAQFKGNFVVLFFLNL